MASWQRYPGAWRPEDEAAGRGAASAPLLGPQEDEKKQQQRAFPGSDGRAQRSPPIDAAASYGRNPLPLFERQYARQQTAEQFPGYSSVPPQGYAGYSTRSDAQQRRDPGDYRDRWMYQAPAPRQPPVQLSTDSRGQWITLNRQEPWVEDPGGLQLHGGYEHGEWGRRRRRDPPSSSRSRAPGFLSATVKLCVFHTFNVVFALVACGILSAGICSAASLIPVCCIGLLIFQVLVFIVFSLAQWDIKLGNYIVPTQQRAYASLLPPGSYVRREGFSGYRISPSLEFFSPLSLMAILYFLLVKPVIGVLSFLSLLLVVAPPASLISSLIVCNTGGYYDSIEIYGVGPTLMIRSPGLSLVGAICVTLIGVAFMQLVAKMAVGATRFFCCEKFAVTTRLATYQPFRNVARTSYGATFTEG
ncbi:unnamed protein product [Phytophthora fragariaefolia]|uniref:Unnamed protein product n=1 Tax=Phytophthora fragariaefolia TaxID=1490495 RepID=A0A9W6XLI6_9STRA|nr:unnamed protein product [Phytophthora fragariaefolia]